MDVVYSMKREMFRRRYSIRTIKTYCYCLNRFLKICHKPVRKITKKDIRGFMENIMDRDVSGNTINVYWNAIKFFYREILHKNWIIRMGYAKTPLSVPEFLTKKEVLRLFEVIENKKHKLMLILMYSAGLRVNELVHLKPRDFDFKYNHGWVRHGKCNKDRLFIIAKKLKHPLIEYIKKNKIKRYSWLFKGNSNNHLSTRTVQEIIKKAAKKAKIKKKVHPHTLRHSFATHLINNQNDLISVQSLLGHRSAETTMNYVHSAYPRLINTKSPYDTI